MHCPFCSASDTRVLDTRLTAEGFQVRRRRECVACNERFTSFEAAEVVMPQIRKRDGSRQPFDVQKLRTGLQRALYKRPISVEQLEILIEQISHKLRTLGEREVQSERLGEWVMVALRTVDQVAYVRFASVYRSFDDVQDFQQELAKLDELNKKNQ